MVGQPQAGRAPADTIMTIPNSTEPSGFFPLRLVSLRGNPVVAVPSHNRRLATAGARRLQGYTPKRRALYSALRALTYAGGASLLPKVEADAFERWHGIDLHPISNMLTQATGFHPAAAVVVWPWPPGQPEARIYIHWLDAAANAFAFTKVGLSDAYARRLPHEADTLRTLAKRTFEVLQTPRVLFETTREEGQYLTVTAVPTEARPMRRRTTPSPTDVLGDISKGSHASVTGDELSRLSWWCDLKHTQVPPRVIEAAWCRATGSGLDLTFVHGDFEPKNILVQRGRSWLLDWEWSHPKAPWLVDHVRLYTSGRIARCWKNPMSVIKELIAMASTQGMSSVPELDVRLALGYLEACQCPEAVPLLSAWLENDGYPL